MCVWPDSFKPRFVVGLALMIFLSSGIIFPWCIFSQSDGTNIWAPITLTIVFGFLEIILGIYLTWVIMNGYESHKSGYSLDGMFDPF
jgi:hypothetical protein